MTKTLVTADTHFGHSNIIEYENRPFDCIETMDAALIKNWNQKVSKQDEIFVLGDFSFYNQEKTTSIVKQLNGHKILVMGNHDRDRDAKYWYDIGFDEVSRYPIIYQEFIVLQHEPPTYFNDATPYFYMYGHVHGTHMYKTITKQTACVSVERWDYAPVDIEKIKELVKLV